MFFIYWLNKFKLDKMIFINLSVETHKYENFLFYFVISKMWIYMQNKFFQCVICQTHCLNYDLHQTVYININTWKQIWNLITMITY